MDRLSKNERSQLMAKVKSRDTKPEMIVRHFLYSKGLRYRLHDMSLPGRPDIKLSKHKTVVFIHGCFWHGHAGCRIYQMPKTRVDFWNNKISNNIERDKKHVEALELIGWKVIILWECQLKARKRDETLHNLLETIKLK